MKKLTVLCVVAMFGCGGQGPTNPTEQVEPSVSEAQIELMPSVPTVVAVPVDPAAPESYISFNSDGSGTWCVVAGGATKAHLVYTVPLRNDAASIYGKYLVEGVAGKCVRFPRANSVVRFPWCGVKTVQIDASRGYGGGAHIGHIMVEVESEATCPRPTPTPTPEPSPSPTPSPDPSPTPTPEPSPSPSPDPECDLPEEGTVVSWRGAGDPQTECRAFGLYDAIEEGDPDFYICKAGNDREVMYSRPGGTCSNGKERSHTTLCVCAEQD